MLLEVGQHRIGKFQQLLPGLLEMRLVLNACTVLARSIGSMPVSLPRAASSRAAPTTGPNSLSRFSTGEPHPAPSRETSHRRL